MRQCCRLALPRARALYRAGRMKKIHFVYTSNEQLRCKQQGVSASRRGKPRGMSPRVVVQTLHQAVLHPLAAFKCNKRQTPSSIWKLAVAGTRVYGLRGRVLEDRETLAGSYQPRLLIPYLLLFILQASRVP